MSRGLGGLSSSDAVRAAIREFDAVGRDAFLEKYGFGPAREYFVQDDGRYYDSKAVVGAACGYQYPSLGPLKSGDFSGGEATVEAKLVELGFVVVRLPDGYPAERAGAKDWSEEEVAATVADYFRMLELELRGEPYNKKEHNRRLQGLLNQRSAGAIEFKHANISAVLIELDFPYIDGYKPRSNYQELLKREVEARLAGDTTLRDTALSVVEAPATEVPAVQTVADLLVPVPIAERPRERVYEPPSNTVVRRNTSYLEIEARNSSLGKAGELFALELEVKRLWEAGHGRLADRIEHVSHTRGDGLGYDILSFEPNGRERLIEVKTTRFGRMTPFFASRLEVAVSEQRAEQFNLYRIFKFKEAPKMFMLSGALRDSCMLDPVQFKASLR